MLPLLAVEVRLGFQARACVVVFRGLSKMKENGFETFYRQHQLDMARSGAIGATISIIMLVVAMFWVV